MVSAPVIAKLFIGAFSTPAFDALGKDVANQLDDDNSFRFVAVRRCTPLAVLWYALGEEWVNQLPGTLGNMFVPAAAVTPALAIAEAALAQVHRADFFLKARALAGDSNADETFLETLTHIPEGLSRAAERRSGFMAAARVEM